VLPSRTQVVVQAAKFRPQSRIGKKPVAVPSSVNVTLKGNYLKVKACFCPSWHTREQHHARCLTHEHKYRGENVRESGLALQ
jgi:ribosomal protein L6P/L9E